MAIPWPVCLTLLLFCGAGTSRADAGAKELSGILGGSVTFLLEIPAEKFKNAFWNVNTTKNLVTVIAGTPPNIVVADETNYNGRLGTPENSSSLQLTGLRMEDTGLYTAQVNTAEGKVTRHFRLRVYRHVPEPTIICHSVTCRNETCNYNLTCTVRDGGENVTYRWTQPETGASVINESILLISQKAQTAPRNLTCTAQNPVSNRSRTAPAKDFCEADSPEAQSSNRTRNWAIAIPFIIGVPSLIVALLLCHKNRRKGETDEEKNTVYAQVGNFPPNGSRKETQKRGPETKEDKTIYSTVHLPNQRQTDDEKLCKAGQESMEKNEKTVYCTVNQPTNPQETVVVESTKVDESVDTPKSKKTTEYDQII